MNVLTVPNGPYSLDSRLLSDAAFGVIRSTREARLADRSASEDLRTQNK